MSSKLATYVRNIPAARLANAALLFLLLLVVVIYKLYAATPNPGHAWTEVGDGLWAATGQTALRTYGFPDTNADVLTDYNLVQGDLLYADAASSTARLPKDTNATRYLSNTGTNNNPAWSLINLANGITGTLGSANGGTGSSFFAISGPTALRTYAFPDANATVLTSNAAVTVGQGGTGQTTLTANNLLVGNGTSGITGIAPGTNGSLLVSNGTTWNAVSATTTTASTVPDAATGALTATSMASLTVYKVGMFTVPYQISVNRISTSITTVTTAGTMKQCVYKEDGTKVIDVTSAAPTSNATLTTTVSPAVTLTPGRYYMVTGCATTCSNLVNYWTTTTASPLTTLTPSGRKIYEGTVTMTSGTCNTTLPTITAAISSTPVGRLDN